MAILPINSIGSIDFIPSAPSAPSVPSVPSASRLGLVWFDLNLQADIVRLGLA
ncbi:hypothetical protein C1645_838993 [Glomus cerebriforme]|uniref:Uncharacterized protein n=1 Tax=Glomus cerebriforme TaxID=658196 RepID=A0A397S7H9_9GLOM|nr:hypothetical protein C1645_838993 [Glomus cerebriforme]